jgi:diguanylate cyclase (GGDEF)-like protein
MEKKTKLFIITNDQNLRQWFEEFCRRYRDIEGRVLAEAHDVERRIAAIKPQALLLDIPSLGFDAALFQRIKAVEPHLPIIALTAAGNAGERLQSLEQGAYSTIEKPLPSGEEVHSIVSNAANGCRQRRDTARAVSEMRERCEADRLNLVELELVKGLQHMIGETEEPVSIFKHSFSLIKHYLAFDAFAALVPRQQEAEIYVYPNVALSEQIAESITGTLIRKMTRLAEQETKIKVVIHGEAAGPSSSDDLRAVVVPLITSNRTYGYAAIYRSTPFAYEEESVFKRFCSHMATALEKINLFEEIKSLSVNDGLTGLHNHLFIVSKLEQEVQRSQRYGSPLSIIIFDIDDFKEVNDRFGHLAGDTVLVELAQMLKKGVRSIDSLGRYGGEEFLLILPETDGSAAVVMGDRLREEVAEGAFSYGEKRLHLSISGGVASFREDGSASALIGIADQNLYKAKSGGKNMVLYDGN